MEYLGIWKRLTLSNSIESKYSKYGKKKKLKA